METDCYQTDDGQWYEVVDAHLDGNELRVLDPVSQTYTLHWESIVSPDEVELLRRAVR